MKKEHYFVIGGSSLQYHFAALVKEMGYNLHIIDYNPQCRCREIADYFHCVSIDDKEEVLNLAHKYKPIAIQTSATEQGNITACYVGEKMGLCTNSYETALNTTDKSRMKKVYAKYNIPNAAYIEANDIDSVDISRLQFPVVVKPSDRSAGRGVSLVSNSDELRVAFAVALEESYNKKVLIEEVLHGKQYTIETISFKGNHQVVGIAEILLDGSTKFLGEQRVMPAQLRQQDVSEMEKLAIKVMNAFDVQYGCGFIEGRLTENGFKVIEVASRMGGWRDHLVELSYGDNYSKMLLDVTTGKPPVIERPKNHYAIHKMIFSKKDLDYYHYLKSHEPSIIYYEEMKEFRDVQATNLTDTQGFYYLSIPSTADVNRYLNGTYQSEEIDQVERHGADQ